MRSNRKAPEEKGGKVPAYIVTFSDMVTLLLTFFVMLLSLAAFQDPELFDRGRDSFLKSINTLGVGVLFGGMRGPAFGQDLNKYHIEEPDKTYEGRTIDAKHEEVRRLFKKVSRFMKITPSQTVGERTNFSLTNIRFRRGETTLNEAAKRFLTEFSENLQQEPQPRGLKLYVLGLAGDETTRKSQYLLSAKRAQAAADFLRRSFAPRQRWPVYCWGAGPGGRWVVQNSPISTKSQILIAVIRGG